MCGKHKDEVCVCRSKEDIRAMDGKKGIVCGVYRQCGISYKMNAKPTSWGHVVIVLEDSTEVMLELEWKNIPPAPEQPMAHIVMPSITEIETIQVV